MQFTYNQLEINYVNQFKPNFRLETGLNEIITESFVLRKTFLDFYVNQR